LEEDPACADHEVLMEGDNSHLLIVGDPQGILDWELRPHRIYLFIIEQVDKLSLLLKIQK
jgi:hypothetical protein